MADTNGTKLSTTGIKANSVALVAESLDSKSYTVLVSTKTVTTDLDFKLKPSDLTTEDYKLYSKFQVGSWPKLTSLSDTYDGGFDAYHHWAVAHLIKDYTGYANKAVYGEDYVIGAIGSPTIELFAASWNEKGLLPKIDIAIDEDGYVLNELEIVPGSQAGANFYYTDGIYVLSSPLSSGSWMAVDAEYGFCYYDPGMNELVRPVVCLRGDMPAKLSADGSTIELLK